MLQWLHNRVCRKLVTIYFPHLTYIFLNWFTYSRIWWCGSTVQVLFTNINLGFEKEQTLYYTLFTSHISKIAFYISMHKQGDNRNFLKFPNWRPSKTTQVIKGKKLLLIKFYVISASLLPPLMEIATIWLVVECWLSIQCAIIIQSTWLAVSVYYSSALCSRILLYPGFYLPIIWNINFCLCCGDLFESCEALDY